MKIINEKGKLFGIINIIDLALLLVIAALAVGAVLYMKREGSPVAELPTKDYYVTILCRENRQEVVDAIKVGDLLYFGNAFTNLEITDVKAQPAKIDVPMPDGTIVSAQHPELKDIYVTVKIIGDPIDPNDPMIYYGITHATVGKNVTLKTTTVEIPAVIIKVEE
ncbi:MAG: DUF4330 domain-containing protein [Ruminiclostridium sp.]|nr:DUF4330 domain-containing protein [Ruminiclostridium sp.]